MNSFRPVALSLCLSAACGAALLFTLSSAKGQPAPSSSSSTMPSSNTASMPSSSTMPGSSSNSASNSSSSGGASAASANTATGSPPLKQVIGISPVQTGKKNFLVFGGTGNESYDLQAENVYSLLRQRGVQIPNVLHPLSTAKPSFIVERLIVLSLTGGNAAPAAGASGASTSSVSPGGGSSSGTTGGAAAQKPAGPSDAERTVSAVRAVIEAERDRGSGRAGGAHRQKLDKLVIAIRSLERANRLGAFVSQAVGGSAGGSSGSGSAATGSGDKSKTDPREVLYGQARIDSRKADLYAPTGL